MTHPFNVILIGFLLIEVYFYASASNRIHFIGYLPFYLCYSYVLNTNLLQSITTKEFFTFNVKDIFMPNINNMDHELRKMINSASFKVESLLLYIGAYTLLTVIMNLYDLFFYEDRLLLQSFLNKESILYHIVRIILCCFFVIAVILTVFSPMQLMFLVYYSEIKLLELLDKIKMFERKISKKNVNHEWILNNLKIFGHHHLDIKRFHYEAFEVNHLYSTLYSITGLIVGMSSLIGMFFLKLLSDALYDLKWYSWDAKCQKSHLLLMVQVAQELKIPILFVIHADFELFKRFIRVTYTVANCLLTLRQNNP
ncbi:hypothetical protein ABEB36_000638 [Hypothenemus hampei]|uniref:Odorant receptor n=1 Tax=Hypothenemus hampei TaxID=57062 RepID=A0ABD1FBX1_HYPHA